MCLSKITDRMVCFSVFLHITILYLPLIPGTHENDIYFAWLTFHFHPFSVSKPSNIRVILLKSRVSPPQAREEAGGRHRAVFSYFSFELSHHHNEMLDGHGIPSGKLT